MLWHVLAFSNTKREVSWSYMYIGALLIWKFSILLNFLD